MSLRRKLALGLVEQFPDEAAGVLEALSPSEAASFLASLSAESAARVLLRTTAHPAAAILAELDPKWAASMAAQLPIDSAASYLRRLPDARREAILEALAPAKARALRSLLRFQEGTAGALMDPEVLALPADLSVREAVERVRKSAGQARYNLYVVDRDDRLVGVLNLRELLLARPRQPLVEIMHREVVKVPAGLGWRALVDHPGWKEVHALPVADTDGTYLGAVRYRTLRTLEARLRQPASDLDVTARSLGELFSKGLTGAVEALAFAAPPEPRERRGDVGRD
ncbi:MAG: magnesium transporter MgtE N-terminal domain-containing protein [Myxococcota bacterium]